MVDGTRHEMVNFRGQEVKGSCYMVQKWVTKTLFARYIKNYPTNFNPTRQTHMGTLDIVTTTQMHKIKGQGHTRWKTDLEAWHRFLGSDRLSTFLVSSIDAISAVQMFILTPPINTTLHISSSICNKQKYTKVVHMRFDQLNH